MVPKSQRPELLMSSGPVPELPGVPDKLQVDTPGELGDEDYQSLWCLYYMEL